MNYHWDQVIAWLGVVVPFGAIAWSAVAYVLNQRREQRFREFQKFHDLMRELGTTGTTVLANVAVAFELRKFPQYKDVIVRALTEIEVRGARADLLKQEFALTIEYLENGK
jgi:sulfur carrier protein ThiS